MSSFGRCFDSYRTEFTDGIPDVVNYVSGLGPHCGEASYRPTREGARRSQLFWRSKPSGGKSIAKRSARWHYPSDPGQAAIASKRSS